MAKRALVVYLLLFSFYKSDCQNSRYIRLEPPANISEFTATRLGDYPFSSVDSRHGDTLNVGGVTYWYGGGGVFDEPQVINYDLVRYNHDTDTWDSLGQLPFGHVESLWKTINNVTYVLNCSGDTLWKFHPSNNTWTAKATGLTFIADRCNFSYGLTNDDRLILFGGQTGAVDPYTDGVYLFDTLGNWEQVTDTSFGFISAGSGNLPLFKGKLSFYGGGDPYGYINPYFWTTTDSGKVWTNMGTSPIRLFWSNVEKIDEDHLLLCCGFSIQTADVVQTYITEDYLTWRSFIAGWEKRHAGSMWNYNNALYFAFGRCFDCNGGVPNNYSLQVWKVEYTP